MILQNASSAAEEENNNVSSRIEESTLCKENGIASPIPDAVEEPIQKQTKSDVHANVASTAAETSESHDELGSWADHVESAVDDDDTCELKSRNQKKESTNGSQCCAINQRAKGGGEKNARNKDKTATINENLDVAMQKLESMRLADKPKRKSTAKRQSLATKDAADEKNGECSVTRAQSKSPSVVSPSQVSSPPSKAKKKKSKKRAKAGGESSDENTTCKAQTDEGADVGATNACDSIKNYDVCVDRTDKNVKCAFRMRVPENERMYINSQDDDSLR